MYMVFKKTNIIMNKSSSPRFQIYVTNGNHCQKLILYISKTMCICKNE